MGEIKTLEQLAILLIILKSSFDMLTEHQQQVKQEALFFLDNNRYLVIKGSAGVGKTFLANDLIHDLIPKIKSSWKVAVCATPTHKALAVIKEKVTPHHRLEFSTIQSVLQLKRVVDRRTGKISFQPRINESYPPLQGVEYLLVDEASMLGVDLLEYIEKYADRFRTKVIFLGDEKQINPVNEMDSPVFHRDYPTVELTEIIRQGEGNPIIDLSRNLGLIRVLQEKLVDGKGYVYTSNRTRIVNRLAEVNGTDELKYLAWTNERVDGMNKDVREEIYGANPKKIEIGETLVFNNSYSEEYYTNAELLVETVEVRTLNQEVCVGMFEGKERLVNFNYKAYIVNHESDNPVVVMHEDSDKHFAELKNIMYQNASKRFLRWIDYHVFYEQFADLKYNHAITVHKSQGSTYKKAIVDIKSINLNRNMKEKTRLLYTAVTRASDLLIIYNS